MVLDGLEALPEVKLAAAIVWQAVRDLSYTGMNYRRVRQEAKDFLLIDLWDPDCVWRELLPQSLTRNDILAYLDDKVER